MTDQEIDSMIVELDELAQRLGCRFVPDPAKLMAFRYSQRAATETIERQQKQLEELAALIVNRDAEIDRLRRRLGEI